METQENLASLEGWHNETPVRSERVVSFLGKYYAAPDREKPHYDALSELHVSGGNKDILDQIRQREAVPVEISVYYEKQEPKEFHIAFPNQLDIYIKGRALVDLLS